MSTTYKIDPAHSSAHFVVRHMMITNVRGSFSGVTGSVVYDPDVPGDTSIHAVIDAKTLNTNDEKRDAHVKSADFMDTDQFPTISFASKRVEPAGSGECQSRHLLVTVSLISSRLGPHRPIPASRRPSPGRA